jgi:hypothetical protein
MPDRTFASVARRYVSQRAICPAYEKHVLRIAGGIAVVPEPRTWVLLAAAAAAALTRWLRGRNCRGRAA